MNLSRKILPMFRRLQLRNFAKEAPQIKVHPKFAKLKETQKRFSIDDGVPIYLKNGMGDKLLYQASWMLVIVGLGLSVQLFVELVMKNVDESGDKEEKTDKKVKEEPAK